MIPSESISSMQNFDYKLVEGLKRQEKRWDPSEHGGFAPIDRGESHRLAADAMCIFFLLLFFEYRHQCRYKLEKSTRDKEVAKSAEPAIQKLEKLQKRFRDDFAANQMLRGIFRVCFRFVLCAQVLVGQVALL